MVRNKPNTPGIIKDPFWQMTYQNPDATYAYINYGDAAEAAEISQPTAKEWLRILQGSGIVYLLPTFANNVWKRLAKSHKLYFCDTGLCA